jgi:hypothetical protein
MTALKAQHNKWAAELIEQLSAQGITRCEWRDCKSVFGVAPAHSEKRRNIGWSKELYFEAAVLCTQHHHFAEYGDRTHRGTHRRMRRLIQTVISREKE